MKCFFDIETLPDMRPGARDAFIKEARENIKPPSDMTKERALDELGITDPSARKYTSKDAALAQWCKEFGAAKADEVGDANWRKTAFDATKGHICCIGWAMDDNPPEADFIQTVADEKDILRFFFSELHKSFDARRRPLFIGHNHVAFDLPFIFRRAVILGVEPPMFFRDSRKRGTSRFLTRWFNGLGTATALAWMRCARRWASPAKTAWTVRWCATHSCKGASPRLPSIAVVTCIGRGRFTSA